MNKAEEYYENHRVIGDLLDKESVCKMLNGFHQSRVNAISDEEIEQLELTDGIYGAKWLKNKLLKQ